MKNKKYNSVFLLLILTSVLGCAVKEAVKNDLTESCINGKVKRISSLNYSSAKKTGGEFFPDKASWRIAEKTAEYNEAGNYLSVFSRTKYADQPGSTDKTIFDYAGEKKKAAIITDSAGNALGKRTYVFLDRFTYAENAYLPSGKLTKSDTTTLDDQYRLKYLVYKTYGASDSIGLYESIQYEYTADNYLKMMISRDIREQINDTIFYQVLQKDDQGNVTKMLNIRNNRKDTGIIIRKYEYYKN